MSSDQQDIDLCCIGRGACMSTQVQLTAVFGCHLVNTETHAGPHPMTEDTLNKQHSEHADRA